MKDNDSLYQVKVEIEENNTVVGLSDYQVYQLADDLAKRLDKSRDYFYNRIHLWLKDQTFEKPTIKIPVGLTEEQIKSLSLLLIVNDNFPAKREYCELISEWCKSQTFEIPSNLTNPHDGDYVTHEIDENTIMIDEAVNDIFEEIAKLGKLDGDMESIKPSWKDAPNWAKYLVSDENGTWLWLDSEGCLRTKFDKTTAKQILNDKPISKSTNALINFDDAPVWARWCAMDADGEWFWYQTKPTVGHNTWDSLSKCEKLEKDHFVLDVWKSTLIENEQFDIKRNVEIGQIRIFNSMKFKVVEVDSSHVKCLNADGFIWSGSLDTFLERFMVEGLEND